MNRQDNINKRQKKGGQRTKNEEGRMRKIKRPL